MPFFRLFSTFALNFAIFLFFWNFLAKKHIFSAFIFSGFSKSSKFRLLAQKLTKISPNFNSSPFVTYLFMNFLRNFSKIAFFPFLAKFRQLIPIRYPIYLYFLRFIFQKSNYGHFSHTFLIVRQIETLYISSFFVEFSKSPKIFSKFLNRPPEKPYIIVKFWEIFENCQNFHTFRVFLKFLLKFCYRP